MQLCARLGSGCGSMFMTRIAHDSTLGCQHVYVHVVYYMNHNKSKKRRDFRFIYMQAYVSACRMLAYRHAHQNVGVVFDVELVYIKANQFRLASAIDLRPSAGAICQ